MTTIATFTVTDRADGTTKAQARKRFEAYLYSRFQIVGDVVALRSDGSSRWAAEVQFRDDQGLEGAVSSVSYQRDRLSSGLITSTTPEFFQRIEGA